MARSEDKFTLKRKHDSGKDKKLSPQSQVIYDILVSHGVGKVITRGSLVAELAGSVKSGKLTTRQDPARILAFYQPQLIKAGILSLEQVKVEKKAKPAAKPTTKAA